MTAITTMDFPRLIGLTIIAPDGRRFRVPLQSVEVHHDILNRTSEVFAQVKADDEDDIAALDALISALGEIEVAQALPANVPTWEDDSMQQAYEEGMADAYRIESD